MVSEMGIRMSKMVAAALLMSAFGVGCGAPTQVEGTAHAEPFSILDDAPAFRADESAGWVYLSMAEEDGETMRVVGITIPDQEVLVVDEPVAIGSSEDDGAIFVDVSSGDLVVTERTGGGRILSTENTKFATSVKGSVTFTSLDPYVGEFTVELDDGGELTGTFVIENQG